MVLFLSFIFGISFLFGLYRVVPYISSNIPLGYDPGIFRAYFSQYYQHLPNIDLYHLDTWIKQIYEPGLGFFTNILQLIGWNVDVLLTFGLVFFSLSIGVYIYLLLKDTSKISAVLGMSMYYISIIQYKAFWWNYYKQILGILFLLVSVYLFQKKKYSISLPFLISLFIINRPSGVFFVLMFVLYKIYEFVKEKRVTLVDVGVVLFAGICALGIYYPIIEHQLLGLIQPLVTTFGVEGTSGTFFTREEFGMRSIYFILLSFGAVYIIVQQMVAEKKKLELYHFGYVVGFLWTTFGLFFYSRMYINFDIFLIIFSAVYLGYLYQNYKKIFLVVATLFFVVQTSAYFEYVKNNKYPLIDKIEFDKIQEIPKLIETDAKIIVTHKNYSPWLIGYAKRDVIAPGLFDWSTWTLQDWKKWWTHDGSIKCEMLADYEQYQNLYLWIGKKQPPENLENAKCFQEVFSGENFIFLKVLHGKNQ